MCKCNGSLKVSFITQWLKKSNNNKRWLTFTVLNLPYRCYNLVSYQILFGFFLHTFFFYELVTSNNNVIYIVLYSVEIGSIVHTLNCILSVHNRIVLVLFSIFYSDIQSLKEKRRILLFDNSQNCRDGISCFFYATGCNKRHVMRITVLRVPKIKIDARKHRVFTVAVIILYLYR